MTVVAEPTQTIDAGFQARSVDSDDVVDSGWGGERQNVSRRSRFCAMLQPL